MSTTGNMHILHRYVKEQLKIDRDFDLMNVAWFQFDSNDLAALQTIYETLSDTGGVTVYGLRRRIEVKAWAVGGYKIEVKNDSNHKIILQRYFRNYTLARDFVIVFFGGVGNFCDYGPLIDRRTYEYRRRRAAAR